MKTCVTEILKAKGPSVYTTDRNTTVFAAIERMEELRVGCLVVTEGDEVCGIVTERDYLRQIAIKGRSSRTTNVGEIMSYPVVCAHVEDNRGALYGGHDRKALPPPPGHRTCRPGRIALDRRPRQARRRGTEGRDPVAA